MRAHAVQTVLLALLLLGCAAVPAASDEPRDAKKPPAEKEKEPEFSANQVRHSVEVANDYYTTGEVDKAETVIGQIIDLTEKCVVAAHKNHHRLKETELELSRASRRLEEVRRSLNLDDQPPVQVAVDKIEKARRVLLDIMFRPPDKPKPEEKKS